MMTNSGKNTLSGLRVNQAMRRQVICLDTNTSVSNSINLLVKYKINALLGVGPEGTPLGVLSKTDIMGGYYAGLPIETPLGDIMSVPPLYTSPEDSLETALEVMREKRIYRLYAIDPVSQAVAGVLAYPDIVGILYQYCRDCDYSHHQARRKKSAGSDGIKRYRVKDIMTPGIMSVTEDAPLFEVMEVLSEYRFGAVLVTDGRSRPKGVISKTDLALAYKHGIETDTPASAIMSSPVQGFGGTELLEDAIRKMMCSDVHRLFVFQPGTDDIIGVISLSDAARIRSGSCHACISSRIRVEQ